jgi:hypothetical protein
MNAMRKTFPCKISNVDLISAFVFIHVGGGFEISEAAKEAIKLYEGKKAELDMALEMTRLRNQIKKVSETISIIELGLAFNINDRLHEAPRTPLAKDQQFRDNNTLDILDGLRRDGKNQIKLDSERLGRQIHQAKGKNNYEKNKGE